VEQAQQQQSLGRNKNLTFKPVSVKLLGYMVKEYPAIIPVRLQQHPERVSYKAGWEPKGI
jgi:hypothetical protein